MILNRILNWINFERNSNIELNQFGYRTGLARREASLVCVWCQQCHKYIRESMSRRCTGSLCQCESSWPICHLMLLMSVLSHNWLFTVILKSCQWCQKWIKSLMSPDTAVSARAVGRLSSRGYLISLWCHYTLLLSVGEHLVNCHLGERRPGPGSWREGEDGTRIRRGGSRNRKGKW